MVFADASALIAMIAGEPDADALSDLLEAETVRLCSAWSVRETVAGLCRSHAFQVPTARKHVRRFLEIGNFRFVATDEQEFELARCVCPVWQRASPGGAEHGRLLCLCMYQSERCLAPVQGAGFYQDGHYLSEVIQPASEPHSIGFPPGSKREPLSGIDPSRKNPIGRVGFAFVLGSAAAPARQGQ
jgi:uncharacterized protein with PIN domain